MNRKSFLVIAIAGSAAFSGNYAAASACDGLTTFEKNTLEAINSLSNICSPQGTVTLQNMKPGEPPTTTARAEPIVLPRGEKETDRVIQKARSELLKSVNGSAARPDSNTQLDTLPRVIAQLSNLTDSFSFSDGDGDAMDDALTLSLNLPICANRLKGNCSQISTTLNSDPSVSKTVIDAINPENAEGFLSETRESLNSADDIELKFTYNFQGKVGKRYWGREPKLYQTEFRAVQDAFATTDFMAAAAELESRIRTGRTDVATALQNNELQTLIDSQTNTTSTAVAKALEEMINNQPQASITASYKKRSKFVGQDEVKVSFSYEQPFGKNLNRFLKNQNGGCQTALDQRTRNQAALSKGQMKKLALDLKTCEEHILSYYKSESDKAKVNNESLRGSFALEYVRRDSERFTISELNQDISYARSRSLIAKLGIGRRFNASKLLNASSLNFEASYEDVSDDDERNDRVTGTLTWAFKVGKATVPISLVYANRPEFDLMDVDNTLTANIGIRYDISNSSD
jgi:hypothetical protein